MRALIPHPSSLILLAAALLLSSCGFQLRGATPMPFTSIYIQATPASQVAVQLRRVVRSSGDTQIADRPGEAQVILQIMNELQDKQILSLSGGGRVSEFRLRYRVFFRLTDVKNREHIPASEIVLVRDLHLQRLAGAVRGIGGGVAVPGHARGRSAAAGTAPAVGKTSVLK